MRPSRFISASAISRKPKCNTSGYCDTISDENGNTISITHNSGNYVTQVQDCTGRTLTIGYDGSHRINSLTDPLSRSWSFSYDTSNQLQTVTLPALSGHNYTYAFAYNTNHDITSLTSPAGNTASFSYNSDNSLAWQQDPAGNRTSFSYTSTTTTITDPNSHTWVDTYASNGTLTQTADAASHTVQKGYDASYNVTQVTDQRGKVWHFTFDGAGNMLTKEDPLSNTWTNTFNSHNKLLTTTDPLSHVVTLSYDSRDNLLSSSDGLSHATTFTVDGYGQRLTATDALSHETQYGYSTNGDLTSVTDANNNETTATFDNLGKPTETTDALSHSTTISYDAWERPISVTTPAGTTSTTYNLDGATLTVTDGNSNTVTTTVDADNRPTEVQQANGDAFYYYYDGNQPSGSPITGQHGLLSATKDGNGHCTYFSYDSLNRKTGVTYPDSTTESWTYDAASNIASHTDGNGATISYSYANDGALTTVTYPSGSGAGTGISYTLDNARRETGMTDQTGTTGTTYDAANRVTQISAPNGTTGYGYDNANRRTSMTLTQGTTVSTWSYTFDAGNRQLTTVSPFSETTTNSYDVANRITSQTLGNGAITDFSYDTSNRITEVQHFKSDGTTLLGSYSYTYDAASNVLTRSDNDGSTTTWQYDVSDQVTKNLCYIGFMNSTKSWESVLCYLSPRVQALVRRDEPLCRYASLRVGGPADYFVNATDTDILAEVAILAQRYALPHFLLGEGSNICVSDAGVRGLVLRNACRNAVVGPETYADAGHNFMSLFVKTMQADLSGLEFAVGIPGTVGGALVSNAGAYRANICDLVQRVEVVYQAERRWVEPEWMQFSYRDSRLRRPDAPAAALVGVSLRLTPALKRDVRLRARDIQMQRILKQPWEPSAGSFFKNVYDHALAASLPNLPPAMKQAGVVPAAYLSEACDCKGFSIGGAAVSPKHANFIVNRGGAKAGEIRQVAEYVKTQVLQRFGVRLEEEALYVGDW